MVTNKALVSMATYMPLDKESFLKLSGTGEALVYPYFAENALNNEIKHVERQKRGAKGTQVTILGTK